MIAFKCDDERDWLDCQRYAISSGYTWKIFAFHNLPIEKPDTRNWPMYLFLSNDFSLEYEDEYIESDKELNYELIDYTHFIRKYKIRKFFK